MFPNFEESKRYPNDASPHLPLQMTDWDRAFLRRLRIQPDMDIAANPHTPAPAQTFSDQLYDRQQAAYWDLKRKLADQTSHPQRMLDAFDRAPIRARSLARERCDVDRKHGQACSCGHPEPHPACYL